MLRHRVVNAGVGTYMFQRRIQGLIYCFGNHIQPPPPPEKNYIFPPATRQFSSYLPLTYPRGYTLKNLTPLPLPSVGGYQPMVFWGKRIKGKWESKRNKEGIRSVKNKGKEGAW
jgi:hypothetical protein